MSDLSATKKTRTPVQNFIGAVIILASITGIVLVVMAAIDPQNAVCQRAPYVPACAEMGACTFDQANCRYIPMTEEP